MDLYRELEVDPAATTKTIDAAWKSLLKRHHPDVAADADGALERVKRLNLAHEWLGDRVKRELYDRSRRRPRVVVTPRATDPIDRFRQRNRTPMTVSPRPASAAAPAAADPSAASPA